MKDFWYWSHMSILPTDGNCIKKFSQLIQKLQQEKKEKNKTSRSWWRLKRFCYEHLPWSTAQKVKFSTKDFFSKCDHIRSFLRFWLHLLKKPLVENFIFCAVKSVPEVLWWWRYNVINLYREKRVKPCNWKGWIFSEVFFKWTSLVTVVTTRHKLRYQSNLCNITIWCIKGLGIPSK